MMMLWVLLREVVHKLFLFGYFMALPVFLLVTFSWALYSLTQDVAYDASWMGPGLLFASTFFAGVLSRQVMNLHPIGRDGLMLLLLVILAHMGFAYLTLQDLRLDDGLFSVYLPKPLTLAVHPYVFSLPITGMLGILFSRSFSLLED